MELSLPTPSPALGRPGLDTVSPITVPRRRTENYLLTETHVKAECLRTVAAVVGSTEGNQTLDLNFVPTGLEE